MAGLEIPVTGALDRVAKTGNHRAGHYKHPRPRPSRLLRRGFFLCGWIDSFAIRNWAKDDNGNQS